jgi:hypothetical protein
MTVLEAHELFAMRTDRSIFPHEVRIGGSNADVWPAVATAAVDLAGYLDDAETNEDLDEGIRQFESYCSMGVLHDNQLEPATLDVIRQLLEWGDAQSQEDDTELEPECEGR